MTMTDTILFVKETSTCHYILHIATPRLCGEPGFKSRHDSSDEAYIRCREIVPTEEYEAADRSLHESDVPKHLAKKTKPVIAPPPPPAAMPQDKETKQALKKAQHELIRKTLERLLQGGDLKAGEVMIESFGDGDEEVVIEFVEADFKPDKGHDAGDGHAAGSSETNLEDILRAVGFDVIGERGGKRGGKSTKGETTGDESKEENVDATHHTVKSATPSAEARVTTPEEKESQGTASSAPQPRDEL